MTYRSMVFTTRFVAQKLGGGKAVVEELAKIMRAKDGVLSIIDSADDDDPSLHAFTAGDIDYVEELLADKARS